MASGRWSDLPLKIRLLIAARGFGGDICRRSDGTINRRLMDLFDHKSPPSPEPIIGVSSSDVTIDACRSLWFRLYTPSSSAAGADHRTLPLIVYLHGGGFIYSAANSKAFDGLCRRFAGEVPAVVVSVNYRRAPEYRYPSAYEDAFDALKFIDAENTAVLPRATDLGRCFLAGDSAGGNIAHHVALRSGAYNFNSLKIAGLIALQPFYGGEERTESELRLIGVPLLNLERTDWMWRAFLPAGSDRDHEAANVSGPRSADISGVKYPATLLVVGGYDPLQDWQRRYGDWLKSCGKQVRLVEYPNAFHGFYAFPELPESCKLITEIKDFIQKPIE